MTSSASISSIRKFTKPRLLPNDRIEFTCLPFLILKLIRINSFHRYFRSGLYKAPHFPLILGREASGTIVATGGGNTNNLTTGTHVAYMCANSTYAEYTATSTVHATKVPSGVSGDQAAAAMLQGLTALTLIRESHPVQKGDWVLVHAAAGGTGLLLCQLLKAVGAHTIGTASSPEKQDLAKQAGAEIVVDYDDKNVKKAVMEATGGKGVVAVFDGVGKATFDLSLECLARKGSMVSFGNASGAVPPVTISRLGQKNLKLLRPMMFTYITTHEEFEPYAEELMEFIRKGDLHITVHDQYHLKDVAKAHEDLEGRKTSGKLLMRP
jgi:NADPH:quinone reductase